MSTTPTLAPNLAWITAFNEGGGWPQPEKFRSSRGEKSYSPPQLDLNYLLQLYSPTLPNGHRYRLGDPALIDVLQLSAMWILDVDLVYYDVQGGVPSVILYGLLTTAGDSLNFKPKDLPVIPRLSSCLSILYGIGRYDLIRWMPDPIATEMKGTRRVFDPRPSWRLVTQDVDSIKELIDETRRQLASMMLMSGTA